MKSLSFQDALLIHFYDQKPPRLLERILLRKSEEGNFDILDLGCGGGRILFSLQKKDLLQNIAFLSEFIERPLIDYYNIKGNTVLLT